MVLTAAAVLIFCLLWEGVFKGGSRYDQWKIRHSGIPDAVSSRTVNGVCCLDVVADADRIEDKAEFARKVVQMCRENSFRSMRLSTDLGGYPSILEIKVYLQREDVNAVEPKFEIRYAPAEETGREEAKGEEVKKTEYNIKDDAEKYKLYIDGKEIPCYY